MLRTFEMSKLRKLLIYVSPLEPTSGQWHALLKLWCTYLWPFWSVHSDWTCCRMAADETMSKSPFWMLIIRCHPSNQSVNLMCFFLAPPRIFAVHRCAVMRAANALSTYAIRKTFVYFSRGHAAARELTRVYACEWRGRAMAANVINH